MNLQYLEASVGAMAGWTGTLREEVPIYTGRRMNWQYVF
jgi:hypothetical protein